MNTEQFLNKVYDRDPHTREYLITVQVDAYSDIFNDLDPSPIRRRDLDQDFLNYLDESSRDIPSRYKIRLQVLVPQETRNPDTEDRVRRGIRTYFTHWVLIQKDKIRSSFWRSVVYFGVGLVLLIPANFIAALAGDNYLAGLASEGIYIGGWVFVWEAVAELAFTSRDLRKTTRRISRTADAPIEFLSV